MAVRVLVPIAEGSEEIETVCIVDTLRRAGAEVVLASIESSKEVVCSRKVRLVADCLLTELENDSSFAMLAIPGGMPGSQRLGECALLKKMAHEIAAKNAFVAAVCAAPARTLGAWGLLDHVNSTAHPSHQGMLPAARKADFDRSARVVVDGNRVTSQGPGTSLEFSLELVRQLFGAPKADELAQQMIVQH